MDFATSVKKVSFRLRLGTVAKDAESTITFGIAAIVPLRLTPRTSRPMLLRFLQAHTIISNQWGVQPSGGSLASDACGSHGQNAPTISDVPTGGLHATTAALEPELIVTLAVVSRVAVVEVKPATSCPHVEVAVARSKLVGVGRDNSRWSHFRLLQAVPITPRAQSQLCGKSRRSHHPPPFRELQYIKSY